MPSIFSNGMALDTWPPASGTLETSNHPSWIAVSYIAKPNVAFGCFALVTLNFESGFAFNVTLTPSFASADSAAAEALSDHSAMLLILLASSSVLSLFVV